MRDFEHFDCIQKRFQPDKDLIKTVEPFIQFKEITDAREIHSMFGPDLPLQTLDLEYKELADLKLCANLSLSNQIKKLLEPENSSSYKCVTIILSRIYACTPQAADVERSIKANNLFKTAFRNRISLETENKYMFVHFNMPPLEQWDPRKAILIWLKEKDRREHSNLIEKKTVHQRKYFKGIFESASDDSDDEQTYNEIVNVDKNVKF